VVDVDWYVESPRGKRQLEVDGEKAALAGTTAADIAWAVGLAGAGGTAGVAGVGGTAPCAAWAPWVCSELARSELAASDGCGPPLSASSGFVSSGPLTAAIPRGT